MCRDGDHEESKGFIVRDCIVEEEAPKPDVESIAEEPRVTNVQKLLVGGRGESTNWGGRGR